jgi:hypothetical protein
MTIRLPVDKLQEEYIPYLDTWRINHVAKYQPASPDGVPGCHLWHGAFIGGRTPVIIGREDICIDPLTDGLFIGMVDEPQPYPEKPTLDIYFPTEDMLVTGLKSAVEELNRQYGVPPNGRPMILSSVWRLP